MARKGRGKSAYVIVSLFIFFGSLYSRCIYHAAVSYYAVPLSGVSQPRTTKSAAGFTANKLITENFGLGAAIGRRVISNAPAIPAVSVAVPDWEVFVIASPEYSPVFWDEDDPYVCLFEQGETSPAIPVGVLPFPNRSLFKCEYPASARRRKLTRQPVLTLSSSLINFTSSAENSQPPLLQWNFLAYDSITTEDDVVLFVKGVNNRQGINRNPTELRCVFFPGDETINAVKTAVTSSIQEVFRCKLPELPPGKQLIKVSLEIVGPTPITVPTVAFYNPPVHLSEPGTGSLTGPVDRKSKLCAATMVYNVAKNLKEWVMYHSRIGVEKFILYDNNSDDELRQTVKNLVQQQGIDITTYFWPWPKTQEAGFSHSTVYANGSCEWMIFTDVDEFLYSKSWDDFREPSPSMLRSVLPETGDVAQLSVPCLEFGPSNRTSHPPAGVTQGYNCRRRRDNRHKSIVLLDAVDSSLANVIHHFDLKSGFKTVKVRLEDMVVNHYKYQAWPEFKAKFRRRVSAYVIDWTRKENPNSNDRTPGLGYRPIEPASWAMRFCEVYDEGLKLLTRRWFGVESPAGFRLAWQSR